MDILEFVKAVAPYVTAGIAVAAVAFTAWLSHRNWIKQFSIQHSEALLKEQIRLLAEVPRKLIEALSLVTKAQNALAVLHTFTNVIAEVPASDARKNVEEKATASLGRYEESREKLQELLRELESLEIIVGIYFGREAAASLVEYTAFLSSLSQPTNAYKIANAAVKVRSHPSYDKVDEQVLQLLALSEAYPDLSSSLPKANELRLSVIRAMAARVNAI